MKKQREFPRRTEHETTPRIAPGDLRLSNTRNPPGFIRICEFLVFLAVHRQQSVVLKLGILPLVGALRSINYQLRDSNGRN
jgi:hypothetical protein